MKKIKTSFLILSIFLSGSLLAQDSDIRPAAFGISLYQNDYKTAHGIRTSSLSSVLSNKQVAKFNEMDLGLALHYFKGLHKHIDLNTTLYGVKTKDAMGVGTHATEEFLMGASAAANFKLVSEKYWVQPYLIAGVGAQAFNFKYYGAYLFPGVGLKANFNDNVHLFLSAQYNVPVTSGTVGYHFNRQLGLAFRIGKKAAKEVTVVETVMPPAPVPIPEKVVEVVAEKTAVVDSDSDGVFDNEDKCPFVAGPASNNGCPEVKEEVKKTINEAAKAIYFVTNGHQLEKRSFPALNTVLAQLNTDKDLYLDIKGHTDDVGNNEYNQALSERRAKSVYDWLIEKGISSSRLTHNGFGEEQPAAANDSPANRQLNRRTELQLKF